MKRYLLFTGTLLFLFFIFITAGAQSIIYSTPQNYVLGISIAPLAPSGSGVATLGYGIPVKIATGFDQPKGIAIDASGSLFVADYNNNVIKEIPAKGGAIGYIGPGFAHPYGISVDASGYLYEVDEGTNSIQKIPVSPGKIATVDPFIINASGLVADANGNVYVSDDNSNSITMIPANGGPYTVLGTGLNNPQGLALDPFGNIYVADAGDNTVKEVIAGSGITVTLGTGFNNPLSVALDNAGNVYVADDGSGAIKMIPKAGGPVITLSKAFVNTAGLVLNSEGDIFVIDDGDNTVKEIKPVGGYYISPSLPSGLNFNYTSGVISGTPTEISPATNYTVTAYNNSGGKSTLVTIAVEYPPYTLIASPVTGTNYGCTGVASSSPNVQHFTVLGSNLQSPVIVSAPMGFEVSLNAENGYTNSVNIPQSGTTNSTLVYVRLSADAPKGEVSGNVTLTSAGAAPQNVAVTGTVNSDATVNPVNSQKLSNGAITSVINFTGTGNTFNWVNDTPGIGLAAIGSGNISAFTAVNNSDVAVTATITVTPVKLSGGYAYVNNYVSNNVSVINTATNTVIATIPVGKSPIDVSVTPDGTKVYVSNQSDNTISVIDVASNSVSAIINIGISPEGIAISPDGNTLYVATGYNAVTVVNTKTNAIINTILVGGSPKGITINRDGSRVYVANESSNTVSVINTGTNKVIATIAAGTQPEGITVSPDGSTLYVADYGADSVSVVSTALNSTILRLSVGSNPSAIQISPDGSKVYVANSNNGGSVSVIQTATEYVESIININNPYGISFSQDGSKVYILSFSLEMAYVYNTSNNSLIAKVPVGIFPASLGNFVTGGSGCAGPPIQFTIVVEPTFPTITTSGELSPLTTIYGTPSSAANFMVSGIFLAEGILVIPPPGFEVSTDGITFSTTVKAGAAGTVSPLPIYIRLAATTHVGNYARNIILSSKGAVNVTLNMPLSTVTPATLIVAADNKSKFYGDINPTLTVTYTGFVNSDGPPQLMTLPLITTTAVTESPVGKYIITPTFATSIDYTFTYIAGVLTVSPILPITIPNAFTPNGDNINDTWNIKSIEAYPHCTVDIFNRYGAKLFSSIGYPIPWDGRYDGKPVPAGTYYYIINLKNGYSQLAGFVAVIR